MYPAPPTLFTPASKGWWTAPAGPKDSVKNTPSLNQKTIKEKTISTIFQKIIDREIPAKIHYEDELCLAFDDIKPQAPVHILLIPKKPIKSHQYIEDKDQNLMGHLLLKAREIALKQNLKKGWRLVVNTGEEGGQTVHHIHIHILGGRSMRWPPG